MSIALRLRVLEESMPRGYGTFDVNDNPVIVSSLDGLDWYGWATKLLTSRERGAEAERKKLRAQLAISYGPDTGGGVLYEVIAALYQVEHEDPKLQEERFFKPFGSKASEVIRRG
jgi:hypothetical protein